MFIKCCILLQMKLRQKLRQILQKYLYGEYRSKQTPLVDSVENSSVPDPVLLDMRESTQAKNLLFVIFVVKHSVTTLSSGDIKRHTFTKRHTFAETSWLTIC